MSDDILEDLEEIAIQELAKDVIENIRLSSPAWDDADFYPMELLNECDYQISQSHLLQDMAYKLNNRESRMNRKLRRGTIYGMD